MSVNCWAVQRVVLKGSKKAGRSVDRMVVQKVLPRVDLLVDWTDDYLAESLDFRKAEKWENHLVDMRVDMMVGTTAAPLAVMLVA